MLTLGLTSGGAVQAALLADGIEEVARSGAQALAGLPACVDRVLDAAAKKVSELSLIAVCTGPGSFTGLRIGVAFAKSLAQGLRLPLIGVSAYDALEHGMLHAFPRLAVIEGKADYYYARLLRSPGAAPQYLRGNGEDLRRVLDSLSAAQAEPVALCGDLGARTGGAAPGSGEHVGRALDVARIGCERYRNGAPADWRSVAIDYGQRPSAVDNWDARRR
jgi:tRNA threonylcarbamoyl adenosine modification protein YeaZ